MLAAGLLSPLATQLPAQTTLWLDHADVGVNYDLTPPGAWDLHVHQDEPPPGTEFEPDEAILGVGAAAQTTVPVGVQWSFLGTAGSSLYVLPQTENPSLLFLGLGTEEMSSGTFLSDQVSLTLRNVSGPGHFAMYDVNMFGSPTVFMNSRDGIAGSDAITLTAGGHRHVNWAFSEPGTYQIDFEASGTLAGGGPFTSSGPVTYTFEVVPEPGTWALMSLGTFGAWLSMRRRKAAR